MDQTTNSHITKIIYMEETIKLINSVNPIAIAELMKMGKTKTTKDRINYLIIEEYIK